MRNYILSAVSILVALSMAAFKKPTLQEIDHNRKPFEICFRFNGTKNAEEGNVEKWEKVTTEVCLIIQCGKAHHGCKIRVTSTQIINGQERPTAVPLAPGTNDPVASGPVTSVSNADN